MKDERVFPHTSIRVYGPLCDHCRSLGYQGRRREPQHLACYLCGKAFVIEDKMRAKEHT